MSTSLEMLKNCNSAKEIKPLLQAVCMGFGSLVRLDVLMASQVGKRQALCFMRMENPDQEEHLMRELGVGRFGGDIVLIVDLKSETAVSTQIATRVDGQAVQSGYQPTEQDRPFVPSNWDMVSFGERADGLRVSASPA